MSIERDRGIEFHPEGTLKAVTRWVSTHDEGIAEWLKNARRAYQPDRANVAEEHRAAVILLRDADRGPARRPARIGLLDVGGVTLEDVTLWSTWQDPRASSRGPTMQEEETQGNGGKAYMYRLFKGSALITGVRDGVRNRKGFEGPPETVERGTPGFVPDVISGREVEIDSWEAEIQAALRPYRIAFSDLPEEVQTAIQQRQAFTLVEGIDPVNVYRGQFDAEDLVTRVVRHEQSTLAVQQLRLYAMHGHRILNEGKPLQPAQISPYPGLEGPFVHEIPEELPLDGGDTVSTTDRGTRPAGRLILHTSKENMPNAHKRLRPRWKFSYRTEHQMIGSKPVSDLAPAAPGAQFIYGTVELAALEPGYVDHGRRRPKDGPLVEALDLFIEEKVRELAKVISELRRRELDDQALDEVQKENKRLDDFKNRFLPSNGLGVGGFGDDGGGPPPSPPPPPPDFGTTPAYIELRVPEDPLRVGRGVKLRLNQILEARVKDASGKTVPGAALEWFTDDAHVADFSDGDEMEAKNKGSVEVWARVGGESIVSDRVPIEVWLVDHVLLTPRVLELPLGTRRRIVAEVTNDEGVRDTNVHLDWVHDADDQLIVRVRHTGWVFGNRLGRTAVTAGAGDLDRGGIWARIPAEVEVIPNPDQSGRGAGFPRLLLTGRDIDPATDQIREGDPDAPALWQEVVDYQNNVWWLNLQSPEAAFAFSRHEKDPELWRNFHVQKVMEMVAQVYMQEEFTKQGEDEPQDYWANHKTRLEDYQIQVISQMWAALEGYVTIGKLELDGE